MVHIWDLNQARLARNPPPPPSSLPPASSPSPVTPLQEKGIREDGPWRGDSRQRSEGSGPAALGTPASRLPSLPYALGSSLDGTPPLPLGSSAQKASLLENCRAVLKKRKGDVD